MEARVGFIYVVLHKLFLRSVGDVSISDSPTLAFTHLSACTTCQLQLDSGINESGTGWRREWRRVSATLAVSRLAHTACSEVSSPNDS